MAWLIDISTEEKKKQVYELFNSFSCKTDIYKYYNVSDGTANVHYLNNIAEQIGFDFSIYKQRKQKPVRYCENCGKVLTEDQQKFCSRSCSATVNNVSRTIKKHCINCGNEITHKNANKYCCNSCQREYEQKQYIADWKAGKEDGISGKYDVSKRIKRYLMDKYECKCQKCGWGEVHPITGNVPLQIHHIDGDCLNNKEENLQLLCPNCHSLTETFGNLNKNSSRVFRKQKENIIEE